MKKTTLKQNISEITKLSSKFPKTLNEALNFNEMEDDEMIPDEEPEMMDEPQHEEMPVEKSKENVGLNVAEFVDDIRKKALRGMAELADNPDDEKYQLLKKIWSICDKKPEQQSAFNTQSINREPNQGI